MRLKGFRHVAERGCDHNPAITVVAPVRDEASNIAPLVAEIAAALEGRAFEIVYVDDASQDATANELRGLMVHRPWLRHIRHAQSCGQSAALRTGVAMARAPIVVTIDGDGQNDPAFLPAMIAALEAGGSALGLVAVRRIAHRTTGFKRLQSRIANSVRAGMLKDGARDRGCGLKAFRRDMFLSLPYFDALHRFLPALVRREGLDIGFVDVVDRPRRHAASHYGLWDRLGVGILDLFGVWWLIRRRRRIPQSEKITLAR
jgi:dolichol-phosphate mannosyltransferase